MGLDRQAVAGASDATARTGQGALRAAHLTNDAKLLCLNTLGRISRSWQAWQVVAGVGVSGGTTGGAGGVQRGAQTRRATRPCTCWYPRRPARRARCACPPGDRQQSSRPPPARGGDARCACASAAGVQGRGPGDGVGTRTIASGLCTMKVRPSGAQVTMWSVAGSLTRFHVLNRNGDTCGA
jgi:hypothetical protein